MKEIIRTGKQYSRNLSLCGIHWGRNRMDYWITFDANCLLLNDNIHCNNTSWNKLFGWSYGWHKRNSIRMVWRSRNGVIQIGACLYENGKYRSRGVGYTQPFEKTKMTIYHDQITDSLVFIVGTQSWSTQWRGGTAQPGYNLGLYYGGDCTAPVTINIDYEYA